MSYRITRVDNKTGTYTVTRHSGESAAFTVPVGTDSKKYIRDQCDALEASVAKAQPNTPVITEVYTNLIPSWVFLAMSLEAIIISGLLIKLFR